MSPEVIKLGGRLGRRLQLINGRVLEVPNGLLKSSPIIHRSLASTRPSNNRTHEPCDRLDRCSDRATELRLRRCRIGVAVIDSGISAWHDDLTYSGNNAGVQMQGNQRVAAFIDFVSGQTLPYDDNGHGTHVSGIIAGNGYDSRGANAGMAPAAHIVSLKVLDREGRGVISDVIAALDHALANRARLQHSRRQPLCRRRSHLVLSHRPADAGGEARCRRRHRGRHRGRQSRAEQGRAAAVGRDPRTRQCTLGPDCWCLDSPGTLNRNDDAVTGFSSAGPSAIDYEAKPDLVASGMGIVSLSDPGSLFYQTKPAYLSTGSSTPLTSHTCR